MQILAQILFGIILIAGIGFFARNVRRMIRNIKLGKKVDRTDQKGERFKTMALLALGQSKMVRRPISGFLHIIVYLGFIIINIEVLEIIIDGLFGTHRIFAPYLGGAYDVLIATFEVLAFLVLVGVIIFWTRRNISRIKRFWAREMTSWPKNDANNILYFEMVLMALFLIMNGADLQLQLNGADHYAQAGTFPISQFLLPIFDGLSTSTLIIIERTAWWLHIVGILIFLNYLYYSKHLHILLAFPNTYFAKLTPKGEFNNLEAVTNEVKLMMDPDADPFAAPAEGAEDDVPEKFGASDVSDLNWVQLLNSYTCTECGRCTSECPANQTGKKLSPRKIMMDTRDRLEEVGENINKNGTFEDDGKQLLDDYILREELWACTTCNACVEACPIGIDPLSIIMDMRRYLVMEQSAAPNELNNAMTNIENNGAPWPYNQMDRLNWTNES
ncbi:(Fe-S)-binding protein [Croceibacter atlanticus]|jgi:heterodisulfide reductase subunit C|uniref:Iron-sulfur protein n=1 Tax=Croceibacter atlanticus (strain ATCC BAA-628 / JCM 21780 / CIP 108009 / IAM 15332 / KCTC 12090 / HTCC2559) TaxID=216432 RepID=A3U9T7_CROAH|nr:(Fe-S)-binding protein [Croceibacter atlanticus]EAP86573.1 iron-sulfur protein [Croceibacter atlanticus HTCC2559]MBW4970954.1 (Fe-S)-binding protein [Croceibacter atlanticus]